MPKIVKLPKAARDHMRDCAKEQLSKHEPHVDTGSNEQPPPSSGPRLFLSSSANEIFTGTDGVEDIFRFQLWKNNGVDTIQNFDIGEDRLILEWTAINGLHGSSVSTSPFSGTIYADQYGGDGPQPTTEIHVANLWEIDESKSLTIKFISPDRVLDV